MRLRVLACCALLAATAIGCEGPDIGFPWDFERMLEQPRDEAYGESLLFADRRSMRTPPPGSVARAVPGGRGMLLEAIPRGEPAARGIPPLGWRGDAAGEPLARLEGRGTPAPDPPLVWGDDAPLRDVGPLPSGRDPLDVDPPGAPSVTRALLERGRDRFGVVCSPCHGLDGRAQTPVAQNMRLRPPPPLHLPRLRALEAADIAGVAARGYGLMPSYADLLDVRDAWAVAWYVKALQRAEHTRLSDLPPERRRRARAALEGAP